MKRADESSMTRAEFESIKGAMVFNCRSPNKNGWFVVGALQKRNSGVWWDEISYTKHAGLISIWKTKMEAA